MCTGKTGHAEVVRITYDPAEVSYSQLLDAFWAKHDPTTLNRQGGDVGTQVSKKKYNAVCMFLTQTQCVY